jgi:hypothetical protein
MLTVVVFVHTGNNVSLTAFKIAPAYLAAQQAEYQAQIGEGKPLLPVFVAQTTKILRDDRDAYLRFGPYWWAVKRVLRNNDIGVGEYDEPMWADEYACEMPELTLIAAWEFADDAMGAYGVQTREYDLDGIDFLLYDPDQAKRVGDPLPEGGTLVPAENGNRAADLDFLNTVKAQTIDMMAEGIAERIETIIGVYPGDAEIEAAVRDAVNSYCDYMQKLIESQL